MSESPTGRTRPARLKSSACPSPLSTEGERLREVMIDAFPECAWWQRRMLAGFGHLDYGRIERHMSHRLLTRLWGKSFDFCVMDDLTPPREPVPPTDVQARISAQTLALFYGGCILRAEA